MVRFFLFLVCNLIALSSFSQISQSKEPSWLRKYKSTSIKPNLDDISEGYYYELIDYQVNVAERARFYKSIKVIYDNNGIENTGEVLVSFNPEYQKLIVHELKIVRDGAVINKLKIQDFKTISSESDVLRSLYNGTKSAYCILEDLRKGDKVIFSFSLVGFNSVFDNLFFDSVNLQSYEPIGLIHANFIIPQGRNIIFKNFVSGSGPVKEVGDGSISYSWERTNTSGSEYDITAPNWYSNLSYVECSEFKDWEAVSNWIKSKNPINSLKPGTNLAQYVDDIWAKAKGDKYRFLQLATDFVQNEVRYLGVEVGEYSHRASLPEKVFDQRYGDCKDKSVLLATILSSKGISANLVLANIYVAQKLKDKLPSPSHFNHMIISVVINGQEQLIDPTITNQGGSIKDRFVPYYGDILNLRYPKALSYSVVEEKSKTAVKEVYDLLGGFVANLNVQTTYYGGDADFARQYYKDNSKTAIQKSLIDYYAKLYPSIKKKEVLHYKDDPLNNIFTVFESYKITDLGVFDPDSKKKVLGIYATYINEKLPIIPTNHQSPVAIDFPMAIEYDVFIVDPNIKDLSRIEVTPMNYDRPAYSFNKAVFMYQDSLKISYRLGFHTSYIPEKELSQFNKDFSVRDMMLYDGFYLDANGHMEEIKMVDNSGFNYVGVLIFQVIGAIGILLIVKYNKSKVELQPIGRFMEHTTIGGWLVILFIACLISVFRILFSLFSSEGLLRSVVWNLDLAVFNLDNSTFKSMIVCEIIANTLVIIFFCYSLYLMIKRRDIFPQTLFYTMLCYGVFVVIDTIIVSTFIKELDSPESLKDIVQSVIFVAIWCTYLKKSERVKNTFVVPYDGVVLYEEDDENVSFESESELDEGS